MTLLYLLFPKTSNKRPTKLNDQPNYERVEPCSAILCNPSGKCLTISPNRHYDWSELSQSAIFRDLDSIQVQLGCELNIKVDSETNGWQRIPAGKTNCLDTSCRDLVAVELKANILILALQLKEKIKEGLRDEAVFVHQGKESVNKKIDVSLISQFSVNRLDTFAQVIETWPGPISITIYLTQPEDLDELIQFFKLPKNLAAYSTTTITLVKPDYNTDEHLAYPINHLRNLAITSSSTEYIFVTDADFMPSSNLYSYLRSRLIPFVIYQSKKLSATAWVVPCFAIHEAYADLPIPNDYNQLRRLVGQGVAYITDPGAGHGPTLATEVAMVRPLLLGNPLAYEACYESQWEPYYVLHRSAPLYDVRFRNQGGDKQSHALQLNAEGYRFMVLREIFMVHRDHQSKMSWPAGGFEKSQKAHNNWSYFEGYMREMESVYGSNPRWPRGCSAMALGWQEQRRDMLGLAAGAV
ncbi:hypothetical protein G6F56_009052 [Rhizopus delemar]|uniref:Glycosyltransferase-like 1B n=1 Tax=Rhizopus stolonifer TaxID=4846 RepID=A0A367ISG5_RHIST|nr:hypothetical protein G6F56_009052 [Rhizopus delemar]RCH80613.1 Glycosyltransferase-like 1B [Rhizopus stolonifer]